MSRIFVLYFADDVSVPSCPLGVDIDCRSPRHRRAENTSDERLLLRVLRAEPDRRVIRRVALVSNLDIITARR